ncbi:hypothetical protein MHI48_05595 [Paenibacillus sp. FSL H7-0942]|nr:hypothetical protein [Paenibacillus amylolyticus]OME95931.1 hypothetical protein BK124_19770 [Paenibacillus amylolyticus]OMF02522.1 hypothetical protein BK129_25055 [Paenibacillus amylolyticus]
MKKTFLLSLAMFLLLLPFSSTTFAFQERLTVSENMTFTTRLLSDNSRYLFNFNVQGDVELRNVKKKTLIWSTNLKERRVVMLVIDQYNGRLKLTDYSNTPYWTSDNQAWANAWYGPGNVPENLVGDLLIMQNDGNLVLYNTKNIAKGWYPVWATNTGGGIHD